MLGRDFHTLIRGCFVSVGWGVLRSSLQPTWGLTIYSPCGPVSSIAHRLVSGSNVICKNLSPPLVDTCHRQFHNSIMCLLGRGFHTLIKNLSFSSPTDVGSHNITHFYTSSVKSIYEMILLTTLIVFTH